MLLCCFFFKQKTAYEMRISDWSSDVCSSDLPGSSKTGSGDGVERGRNTAQHRRIAGGTRDGSFGELDQRHDTEGRRQPLQALCGDSPVRIAARAAHQVGQITRAANKGTTQIFCPGGIVAEIGRAPGRETGCPYE